MMTKGEKWAIVGAASAVVAVVGTILYERNASAATNPASPGSSPAGPTPDQTQSPAGDQPGGSGNPNDAGGVGGSF
jgi:hypothetical protein